MPIELNGFDIVLCMDWLSANDSDIKCRKNIIVIKPLGRKPFIVYGDEHRVNYEIICLMKARNCLSKRCTSYLKILIDVKKEKKAMQRISVVCDFLEVFPEDPSWISP